MLIVTLCAAVALLGAVDCHVIPAPLETSELALPPLVENTGGDELMALVEGEEDDGQTERAMEEAVEADSVEEGGGGEVVDGGRGPLAVEDNQMVSGDEDWERAEEMARSSCPGGWRRYGQRCFRYESTSRTWAEAERNCLIHGANLASVHSTEEYHFLQTMTTSYTWLGGYDATQEHLWFWSDGSRMVYQNWARGEPNNDRGQHCLAMNSGGMLLWDDGWCSTRLGSICAKSI